MSSREIHFRKLRRHFIFGERRQQRMIEIPFEHGIFIGRILLDQCLGILR